MSQSSVSRSITAIAQLILDRKGSEIEFPNTDFERTAIKIGFNELFGIKGTVGAIDCTHVAIVTPASADVENPVSMYMNRKGFYSINVEAICEFRMLFLSINAKFPGSCRDSGIWATSLDRMALMEEYRAGQTTWLLGDQGYPLVPWLLTPFGTPSSSKEEKYNRMHCKAQNVVERAFGVLKGRFRCLSKDRVLHYSHPRTANIIYACAILHNILIKNRCELDPGDEEMDILDSAETMALAVQMQIPAARLLTLEKALECEILMLRPCYYKITSEK